MGYTNKQYNRQIGLQISLFQSSFIMGKTDERQMSFLAPVDSNL